MGSFRGMIFGHHVFAELSMLTGRYIVEIDGVRRASGMQLVADRPLAFDLDGHQIVVRFFGTFLPHVEIIVDGRPIYRS